MSDSGSHTPPPFGEALTVGWNAVKPQMVPAAIASFCAYLANMIAMGTPGFFLIAKKLLRGEKPEPADGFIGFSKFADYFIMGLLASSGVIACFVGMFITIPLFLPGFYFIMEHNMTWSQAKDKCMELVKPHLMSWAIFQFVVLFVGGLGSIACFVGVFVTMPVGFCACYYAYEKAFKELAPAAEAPAVQPV